MDENIPFYNLSVVVRETGINPDTLRAWERRYGLPMPHRTTSGHRLYTQNEIGIIKWLLARTEEGLRINAAVALWHSLETSGQSPFAQSADRQSEGGFQTTSIFGETLDGFRRQWIDACLAFDELSSEYTLTKALAYYPVEEVCHEVLQNGLVEIGRLWNLGTASVQQEHFASAMAMRRVNTLIASTPPPSHSERILIGCPSGEEHVIPSLILTLLLRQRGWNLLYLGPNVPLEKFDATLLACTPSLVILSSALLTSAANLAEIASFLHIHQIMFAYSGRNFIQRPRLKRHITGHFLGNELKNSVFTIENLIKSGTLSPNAEPLPDEYKKAWEHFYEKRTLIDANVWVHLHRNGLNSEHINLANKNLSENILAALKLGDLDSVDIELEWIEALLAHHGLPKDYLTRFLKVYNQALKKELDNPGKLVLDWFEQRVNSLR